MITLFTCPKSFENAHNGIIQENAIASWRSLGDEIEIILCCDDPGVSEIAKKYDCKHIPEIRRNKAGTPLLSDIFAKSQEVASFEMVCYLNSDIILMDDFCRVLQILGREESFLAVGKRKTLEINKAIDYDRKEAHSELVELASRCSWDSYFCIDYFIFSKGKIRLPDFAIGRPAWDNWTLWYAKQEGMKLIDCTDSILAIHHQHDYQHVKGGVGNTWEGPEAQKNRELAGGYKCMNDLRDANYFITKGRIKKRYDFNYLYRLLYQLLRKIKHKII